jgi:glutamate-ammonia-ligase adenylyltransferase
MQGRIFGQTVLTPHAGCDDLAAQQFWLEPVAKQWLPELRHFIDPIIKSSPYLRGLLLAHAEFASRFKDETAESLFEELLRDCQLISVNVMHELRLCKARVALLVAMADLCGTWTDGEVTASLTKFADNAVQTALAALLLEYAKAGRIIPADSSDMQKSCGYVVLAMGKHGAGELNYSSDIDLIVLYDSRSSSLAEGIEPSIFFVKLTRQLVALLQDVTEDGYVFRVDLRLRPDPRATQIAIDLEAAAVYYENQGQNWERAAMIKARAIAGDMALGAEFIERLIPYIWRRYLDFAAIADIQSLKRQIHDVKGHGQIAVQGHNIKLGRGGIREIEFFAQTQQLIAGGKNKSLRVQRTVESLWALHAAGWIAEQTANELTTAYWFLRKLEHRIQMLEDRQDHSIPTEPEAFENYARFAGFENGADLSATLLKTLHCVSQHYQVLFKDSAALGSSSGSLVFTGGEDDPATIETLQAMGFHEASEVSATIRGWHFGRYPATRSKTSRELLTELMPQILQAFAATGDADRAFLAFDGFIRNLPSGVQLFSMLRTRPQLLDLLARVMGLAPRLTSILTNQPRVLEAVLDTEFFDSLPSKAALAAILAEQLQGTDQFEEKMDRARIFAREQNFRVAVRILSETMSGVEAGMAFSNIADCVLSGLHHAASNEIERKYGQIPGGASAIVALGKLGGREMTATSDLDLMLIYDHDPAAEFSDGPKPLSAAQYYARLTQLLITALTAPTAEGTLYDVDMRLRPSGSKGPVAVSLSSFISYQQDSAWTWEKLALTRARIVSAPTALSAGLAEAIQSSLAVPRDRTQTLYDVQSMRGLMLREKGQGTLWDLKSRRGGLVDIEFIAQTLQILSHPLILATNTGDAISALRKAGQLAATDADNLAKAWNLYTSLSQTIRLCALGDFQPENAPLLLNRAVAASAKLPDIATTTAEIIQCSAEVVEIFDRLLGPPII